ncbi:potassium channel family protein [Rhodobaculum claviforme]|uniref:Ion transporter n=1 Tax=Rhodobaculum claviforme TaxID=1549854 RepID=A0A934TMP6_9RHOB|nr:potassium channel family protein [Rhodobaculum claviforme]MBK5928940.1 ion transporter [Rhodobaculum claviforme]
MALRETISALYTGRTRRAARFRYTLIGLDVITVAFFIVTVPLARSAPIAVCEAVIGALILVDMGLRLWIAPDRWRSLWQVHTLADLVVVVSLVAEPLLGVNLSFLKALRALRLVHSWRVAQDLRRDTAFFREHEQGIVASVDLFAFIFVATSAVYVLQFDAEPGFAAYADALYFTVATLTTTGYGDITMTGTGGKLMAVVMMVAGVALFFRLARALFVPRKVIQRCTACGLNRHDPDAIHCKHCGATVNIPTGGAA